MTSLEDFTSRINGDVVTPNHSDYQAAIARWAKNAERRARLVVYAKTTDDVAACIAFAKEHRLIFAIKGGGHQAAGASSALGGIVVDLSRYMSGVAIDVENRLARVGGGAVWKTVDDSAIEHGLASVAGTINHTGVGGLTLGGGYGWLTGRHGMVLDNLMQATVVLADGSAKTASDLENPDLFWAIRGGGSNFGVVTEFVLRLHPQDRKVFAGTVAYKIDQVDDLVNVTTRWWAQAGPDEVVFQWVTTDENKNPVVIVCIFYNGLDAEGRAIFKEFFDLGPFSNNVQVRPYEEMNALMLPVFTPGRCRYMKGVAQRQPDAKGTLQVLERCAEVVARPGTYALGVLYEYIPDHAINTIEPSATAFKRITSGSQNIAIVVTWDDDAPENTQWVKALVNELADDILSRQTQMPEEDNSGYFNYALDLTHDGDLLLGSKQLEQSFKAFGNNLPRLREVKKKYDPEVFFNRWCPIPPAL